jgi:hypothetical protein
MTCYIAATMPKYKVGDHLRVKLSGGRIVVATIKAVVERTDGIRLQVSFGNETALIYLWEIVENPNRNVSERTSPDRRQDIGQQATSADRAAFGDGCDQQAPVNIDKQ